MSHWFTAVLLTATFVLSGCHVFESVDNHPFPEDDGLADSDGNIDLTVDGDDMPISPDVQPTDVPDVPVLCMDDGDCDATCGERCEAGVCIADCLDCDGDGFGVGCDGGLDCDDTDNRVRPHAPEICEVAGGLGVCGYGVRVCGTDGQFSACTQITPREHEFCNDEDDDCNGLADDSLPAPFCLGSCSQAETCDGDVPAACNNPTTTVDDCSSLSGVDDDCDGIVDDACTDDCIWVSPGGVGSGASRLLPTTLNDGLSMIPPTGGRICMLSAPACLRRTYPLTAVSVPANTVIQGSFDPATGMKCPNRAVQLNLGPSGVRFEQGADNSSISGLVIQHGNNAAGGVDSRGVVVDGADTITISDVSVISESLLAAATGITVENGGFAIITGSLIHNNTPGVGVGIAVDEAKVHVVDMCPGPLNAEGQCEVACDPTAEYAVGVVFDALSEASGIVLTDASPASSVERTFVCVAANSQASGIKLVSANPNLCPDCAGPVLLRNGVHARTAEYQVGVSIQDTDSRPRVSYNDITFGPGTNGRGVSAFGTANPLIEGNVVEGGSASDGLGRTLIGIECTEDNENTPSCTVVGNAVTGGSIQAGLVTGLVCSSDSTDTIACPLVAYNLLGGGYAPVAIGALIKQSQVFMTHNLIVGGCGTSPGVAIGVKTEESLTVMRNNFVVGSNCDQADGVGIAVTPGSRFNRAPVLDSNSITGGGSNLDNSIGLYYEPENSTVSWFGAAANNIIHGGSAQRSVAVLQESSARPTLIGNAIIDDNGQLYEDPARLFTNLDDIPWMDPQTNFQCDPKWVDPLELDLHLGASSDCVGRAIYAPPFDIDNDLRDQSMPDVGADEF